MGCDYYIVTVLEGIGVATSRGLGDLQLVQIRIEYASDRGYFLHDSNDDSDDEDARRMHQMHQMQGHEKIRALCSDSAWVDEAAREKYMAIVMRHHPDIEVVRDLSRITYTVER